MRHYLAAFLVIIIIVIPWLAFNHPYRLNATLDILARGAGQLAAVITHKPKTVAGLQFKYNTGAYPGLSKIRVLIVPGHEPDYGGAEFLDLDERDLVVELSHNIADILDRSGRYQVFITRDRDSWDPVFEEYFENNKEDILDWQRAYRQEMSRLVAVGSISRPEPKVIHNRAPLDVALRLYSMTKWANENDIDLTIHVHLNDYPGHPDGIAGKYSGFAIYAPAAQYLNSTTTHAMADTIFKRLVKYNPVSNMPLETGGIIDESELIAIGAYNTSDAPSMLIEYGYLYEPQFADDIMRSMAFQDLAYQTYLGLQDFFDPTNVARLGRVYDTMALPHIWSLPITARQSPSIDIYALQTAMLIDGLYPPSGEVMNDCPRTGKFGSCTRSALESFQDKYKIDDEKGYAGPKTLKVLNQRYGVKTI